MHEDADDASRPPSPATHNDASGVVHGTVLQAGSIGGDVVINADTFTARRRWRARGSPDRGLLSGMDEWTEALAHGVQTLWRQEEDHRRVHDPVALPVRWRPAAPELSDHWANILRLPAGATAEPLVVAGRIEHLAEIYQSIPSGRLVILGRAGAGKTVLTSRLALDLLDSRRRGQPVPVIVSVGSWNPEKTPLHIWLAEQLTRDHPGLAARVSRRGPTHADALIGAGRVLPILDGFDEIDAGLHQAALRQLNTTPGAPMVITSRTTEYTTAVHGEDVLTAAAVIELDDLPLNDPDDYLPRTAAGGTRTGIWDPILQRMRTEPHAPGPAALRQVLTNPLMVFLARTIYSDTPNHNPTELLDNHRFPTTQALQDHLLAAYLPAVYQPNHAGRTPRWPADRARHYLTYLATHLHKANTRDLAWWQLRDTIPRPLRTLIFALLDGLLVGLLAAIGTIGSEGLSWSWLVVGLTYGLPIALASGLTVTLTVGLTKTLRSQHLRPLPRFLSSKFTIALLVGPSIGFTFVLATAFSDMLTNGYPTDFEEFIDSGRPIVGGLIGLVAGIVVGLIGLRSSGPLPTRTRLQIRGQARFIAGRFVAGFLIGFVLVTLLLITFILLSITMEIEITMVIAALAVGLMSGPAVGFVAAVTVGLDAPINAANANTATLSLTRDRRNTIRKMLAAGLTTVALWLIFLQLIVDSSITFDVALGLGATCLVIGYASMRATSAWIYWLVLTRGWLPLSGHLPWRIQGFLTDAYQRGVLRQTGTVYQFRHARLQDHLTANTPATDG